MTELAQLDEIKARQRKTWAAGDYGAVARKIWSVGEAIVARAGVGEGDTVLDVACGTGNATLPAAAAGARVTGLDLTPKLLEEARAGAAEAGREIEFVEGDAEELPFADASFDVVLSTFGVMFAPRHEVAASELARVVRPGGRIGLACWTPEGAVGTFFRTTAKYLPAPPPGPSPVAWGSEDTVAELLGESFELELERATVGLAFTSVPEAVRFYEERFGPTIMTRAGLDEEGRQAFHDEMIESWESDNAATDGTALTEAEYLVITGRRR